MLVDAFSWAFYYVTIFYLLLLFGAHMASSWAKSQALYRENQLNQQIEFLMTGDYQKLLKFARSQGLVTKPIKKYQLCTLIAIRQLSSL